MLEEDIIFQEKYLVGRKLGAGSFGAILLGTDLDTGKYVALKFEKASLNKQSQLPYETKVMRNMIAGGKNVGIPRVQWLAMESEFNIMVMDLLGPSLADLFNYCGQKFSLKTTLMVADQMLQRIEQVHKKNYIHRDIKPDNFLMGLGADSHIVYIIDFGLAKKFRDAKSQQHIPYKESRNLTGTARYASLNAHLGIEQSRRDDLEAIGYCLVYYLQGKLPWQNLQANNRVERYSKIAEIKLKQPVEVLCQGMPLEFSNFFHYVRALRFEDRPDYTAIRSTFKILMKKEGYEYDHMFDWVFTNPEPVNRIFTVESFDNLREKEDKNKDQEDELQIEEQAEESKSQGSHKDNENDDSNDSPGKKKNKNDKGDEENGLEDENTATEQHDEEEKKIENANDISQLSNKGLLDEGQVKVQEEEKQQQALINRFGILGEQKPQKKFMMINKLTPNQKQENSNKNLTNKHKKKPKHRQSAVNEDKCSIF